MSTSNMAEELHFAVGIAPIADFAAGTTYTDVISMKKYHTCTFVVMCGSEATGTTKITVQACDNVTPSNTQAVACRVDYDVDAGTSSDTFAGMAVSAAATGITTTAGAGGIYVIQVNSDDLYQASGVMYEYVRLSMVEVANSAVTGGVLAILSNPRYGESVTDSAIV